MATLAATTTTTTPTRFGVRTWSASGRLEAEYWIVGDHLQYSYTAGSESPVHAADDSSINNPTDYFTTFVARSKSASHVDLRQALSGPHSTKSHLRKTRKSIFSHWRAQVPHSGLLPSPSSSPSSDLLSPAMSVESATTAHRRTPSGLDSATPPEKRLSLFKRLSSVKTHGRRTSQQDFPQPERAQPDVILSPTPQDRSLRPQPRSRNSEKPTPQQHMSATQIPKSALLRPSITTTAPPYTGEFEDPESIMSGKPTNDEDSGVVMYPDGLSSLDARSSKGIRFADDTGSQLPNRPRRTSSAATHGRRSSIYSKAAEGGDFIEGVDAGVGSKARRLSVMLPDEMHVDECRLEEYFSLVHRHNTKEIGSGGAAVVRLMKSKTAGDPGDRIFAVKEFRPRVPEEEDDYEYERKIKSEFAISKSCKHPNIVKTFRLCHTGERWFHVMEYCELGDLNDLINRGYFAPRDRDCMFKQLVRGIDYLHERGIAHRDIKSENLLVSKDGCLKLADFGTGEVFSGKHPGVRNCEPLDRIDPDDEIRLCQAGWVGSKPYMAPEICQRTGEYDPRAVDVWSAAIVYLTLFFGANPWDSASTDCKNFNIYAGTWDKWLETHPDGELTADDPLPAFALTKQFLMLRDQHVKRLIFCMLHPDPAKRWTIHEVLESKVITDFECCQQEGYSDDIRKRQKKAMHNHVPPDLKKKFLSAHK